MQQRKISFMKFANIIMTRKGRITIGDDAQLLAIENLYKYMGVDYKDVVRIPFNELATYDGEYVVLPISFPLYGYSHGTCITQYSDKIIPVFLGYAILTDELDDDEVQYLKKYEPIGCRDNFTLGVLRKYGIISYLNGCMTATFPLRDQNREYKNIYCVDISEELDRYIPESIKKQAIYREHVFLTNECPSESSELMAKKVYQEYWDNAKLIITTRLHAALPCLSAGIPVVLAKDSLSYRFAFLSNYLPLYSKAEFGDINWNPEPVDMETMKSKILECSAKRVREAYDKYKDMFEISEFYEMADTARTPYFEAITDAIEYVKANYDRNDVFKYSIWAITQTADMVCRYIERNYPNAIFEAAIDRREGVEFHGLMSTQKEWLEKNNESFCFVCAPAAMIESKEYFKEIGHDKYLMCWSDGLSR